MNFKIGVLLIKEKLVVGIFILLTLSILAMPVNDLGLVDEQE